MKIPSEVRLTEMEKGAPAFPTAEHLTLRLGASILELKILAHSGKSSSILGSACENKYL